MGAIVDLVPSFGTFPAAWIEKAWGHCRTLFVSDEVEIVECHIVSGGYSSIHKHLNKDNTFIVLAGEIEIQLYPALKRPDCRTLTASPSPLDENTLTVLPMVPHKFVALQASRIVEVYRAQFGKRLQPGDGDIVRMSEGGVRQ